MVDVASLGLRIDSSQAKSASTDLDRLSASSGKAETAVQRLGVSSAKTASAENQLAGTARAAALAQDKLTASSVRGAAAQAALGVSTANVAFRQRQLAFQINDIGTSLASGISPFQTLAQQGGQVIQVYAGQGGVRAALSDVRSGILGIARAQPVATAAIIAGAAALAAMTIEINRATGANVSFGDVATATAQVVWESIRDIMAPAWASVSPLITAVWDNVVTAVKNAVNRIIGLNVAPIAAIVAAWETLPAAFGDIGISAAQKFIDAITFMARDAVAIVNGMITSINGAFKSANLDIQVPTLGRPVDVIPGFNIPNPLAGSAASAASAAAGAASGAFNRDYLGDLFGAVRDRALQNSLEGTADAANKVGGAADRAGRALDLLGMSGRAASDNFSEARGIFTGFFRDVTQGIRNGEGVWESFRNAAVKALESISQKLLDLATNQIFNSLVGGSFLSGVFGGGGGGAPGGSIFGLGRLYATGGYTGDGTKYQPAGIVHAGEYVMTAAATKRLGVPNLNAMNYGYANGGFVGRAGNSNMAAPSFVTNISVNGGGTGNPRDDDALARRISERFEAAMDQRIAKQMRAGGLLNPVI